MIDEVQNLPYSLLKPILASIENLATNFNCSVVLCTATQPSIRAEDNFYRGLTNIRELAYKPNAIYAKLNRATINYIGLQQDDELIHKLSLNKQVLIIVNNRQQAIGLYEKAVNSKIENVYVMTTLMCAQHRSETLKKVKELLDDQRPCRLIATSLIEAGVDIDFPMVMRSVTGLDSVLQAAGRCNREGNRKPTESIVEVFEPTQWNTPAELNLQIAAFKYIADKFTSKLSSTLAVKAYYQFIFQRLNACENLDKHHILRDIRNHFCDFTFPFQDIESRFQMISSNTKAVIVPFDVQVKDLITKLAHGTKLKSTIRKIQRYTIQITEHDFKVLTVNGLVIPLNSEIFNDDLMVLNDTRLYTKTSGFTLRNVSQDLNDKYLLKH